MRKFLLIAVCFFLSVCSVWSQGPGEIIARQTVVRYTWTGGTTNLVNYVPRLNVNGQLDASFVPYLVSTNYLAQFSNNFWQATLALVGGATNQWDYTAGTNYIAGLNYVTAAVTNGILSSANSYTTNYVAQYSNANWQATLDLVGGSTNGWNFTAGTNWVLSQNYVTQSVTNGLLASSTAATTYLGITSNAVSSTFATTAISTTGSVVIPFQMDTTSNRLYGWWVFDTIQATTGIFVTVSNVYSVQSSNIIVNNVYATNVYAETLWGMLNGTSTNADRLQGYTASAFAGTNDVTKTSITNTIAGVYVETANAGWVDILSKTNSWNNKAETSVTNGLLSSASASSLFVAQTGGVYTADMNWEFVGHASGGQPEVGSVILRGGGNSAPTAPGDVVLIGGPSTGGFPPSGVGGNVVIVGGTGLVAANGSLIISNVAGVNLMSGSYNGNGSGLTNLSDAYSYTDGATNAQGILIGNLFTSNSTMQGQVDGLFVSNSTVVSSLGGYLSTNGGTVSWLKVNGAQTNVGPVSMNDLTIRTNLTMGVASALTAYQTIIKYSVVYPAHPTDENGYMEFYIFPFNGTNYARILPYTGSSYIPLAIGDWNSGNPNIMLMPGGNVGIGTGTPAARLHVAGGLLVTSTSYFGSQVYAPFTTGTSPSNVMTFALGDARYLSVTGTSNNMAWTSLPYNGSWQTNAMTLTGVTSATSNLMCNVSPCDPGAVYIACYLAPNLVNVTRLATSTLNPVTNAVTVSSGTPLLTSGGLVASVNGLATNLTVNGAFTANGTATFGSTINAANATGTSASDVANVGTLDARHGVATVSYFGYVANGTFTTNSSLSANGFGSMGGFEFPLGPSTTKLLRYSVNIINNNAFSLTNTAFGPTLAYRRAANSTYCSNLVSNPQLPASGQIFGIYAPMSITGFVLAASSSFQTNITFNPPVNVPPDLTPMAMIRCFTLQWGGEGSTTNSGAITIQVSSEWSSQ